MLATATRQIDGLWGASFSFVIVLLFLALFLAAVLIFLMRRRYRRQRRNILRQIQELEALSEAGRALVEAELDIADLCELIATQAGQFTDTDTFQIGLFHEDEYHIVFWKVGGRRRSPQSFELVEDGGLVGWVRQHRQPLLIRDFIRERDQLPAHPNFVSSAPLRSGIFIPLLSGEETLGILVAQSQEPNHFTDDDQRRVTILANQAAAAIANARLFEQERMRATHLALVGEIAQRVNASQDLDELFSQVVTLTYETFGFHPVNIFGIVPHNGNAVIQASSRDGVWPGTISIPAGKGLIGTAVATRETIVSNNTRNDERFILSVRGDPDSATRAEIVIPLIVDDQLLGVLDVQSETPGVFSAQEQTVLEALAAQVAIAIHKTRQLASQREQAWVTTAQLQVADAIRQSNGMEELLEAVARLTPLLVGVDQCTILLWNDDVEAYEGGAAYGLPPAVAQAFTALQLPIGDWGPLDAVHVGMTRLSTEKKPPWLEKRPAGGQSHILYPLIAKGRMVGVMAVDEPAQPPVSIQGYISESFTDRQDELLRNVANQVAQAIESEQLHIAQQEEAWVNTALLQVAEAVNSLIDLNEILDTIVRFIPMLVGVKSCIILVWDEESETFRAGPSYGIDEMSQGLLQSFAIDLDELPVMEAREGRAPTPSTTAYKINLPTWLHDMMGAPTATVLPLYARSSLVGALLAGPSVNRRPLAGRRLSILTGIAQQAAIAVVNDQLYKEAAERNRLEQELDVARQIQTSFIPPGSPEIEKCRVASFWQAARQVGGDFYDFLELPDGRWGIVVADVADKGVPAALFMALSRTIIRTIALGQHEPASTLERANRILWNDTTSDLFVTVFYAIWDPAAERLAYGNAGHNPPLLLRRGGESQLLRGDGIAMGVLEDVTIEQNEVALQLGDVAVFYTDGVTEAMNEDNDEFGMDRLRLAAEAAQQRDAAEIVEAITRAIRDFAGDTPQFDDITLVVTKRQE